MRRDLSLRRTLTSRLIAALLLMTTAAALFTYALTSSYANLAYDRALQDLANSLSQQLSQRDHHISLDLPQSTKSLLLADQYDKIAYRITALDSGRVIDQFGDLGALPDLNLPSDNAQFRDVRSPQGLLRVSMVVHVFDGGQRALVEIGETRHKRDLLIRDILIGLAVVMGALILVTIGLVWRGISQSLSPLAALEKQAALRSLENLSPLDPGLAPREVRGLIAAINGLMNRLDQSVNLQKRFTANAAHQLRTPLTALRLQAQLALKTDEIVAVKAALQDIEASAARTSHVIDQLLALARAEVGSNAASAAELIDLAAIAREVIERFVPQALSKHLDLAYEGNAHTAGLRGYPTLLAELLANLIDNAIRYCHVGGSITVEVKENPQGTLLTVCDDGPGIPASQREQVFQRFFRGDTLPTEGAGLGLAIVREIADRHAATLTLSANENGTGCKIAVQFATSADVAL